MSEIQIVPKEALAVLEDKIQLIKTEKGMPFI